MFPGGPDVSAPSFFHCFGFALVKVWRHKYFVGFAGQAAHGGKPLKIVPLTRAGLVFSGLIVDYPCGGGGWGQVTTDAHLGNLCLGFTRGGGVMGRSVPGLIQTSSGSRKDLEYLCLGFKGIKETFRGAGRRAGGRWMLGREGPVEMLLRSLLWFFYLHQSRGALNFK